MISSCLTLFVCGGPCHLSSIKQHPGTLFSSENSFLTDGNNKYIWVRVITSVTSLILKFLHTAPLTYYTYILLPMDYHFNPSRFFLFFSSFFSIPATWDRAAESRSESEQRAWAAHQHAAPLLLCSRDHRRACEDRDRSPYERTSTWAHIYTVCLRLHLSVSASDVQTSVRRVCAVRVFLCVCCIYYLGRQASYPGLTAWLDPARIPMKQWVSLRQPRSPCGPGAARGPDPEPPSPRSEPDAKTVGMESAKDSLRF